MGIKDEDFHNFLRWSDQLKSVWCKLATNKDNQEDIERRIRDDERNSRRRDHSPEPPSRRGSNGGTRGGPNEDSIRSRSSSFFRRLTAGGPGDSDYPRRTRGYR